MSFSSSAECITWLVVLMAESVAIVTLNLVTIIVFMKNRSLRRRSMYFVINLAVADMLVGAVSEFISFFITGANCNFWTYNVTEFGIWDNIIFSTELLFPVTSLTNIAAISLERTHATFRPFRHRFLKNWVYIVLITIIWVLGLLLTGIFYPHTGTHLLQYFYSYIWSLYNLICLVVICVSLACIIVKMVCGGHPQHHGAASRERKLTVTLSIVTLLSLLLYLPLGIFVSVISLNHGIYRSLSVFTFKRLNYSLMVLLHANSLVNPILYALRIPEFKRALVSLFHCRSQQRQVVFPLRVM